jgi:hypothetical protein
MLRSCKISPCNGPDEVTSPCNSDTWTPRMGCRGPVVKGYSVYRLHHPQIHPLCHDSPIRRLHNGMIGQEVYSSWPVDIPGPML